MKRNKYFRLSAAALAVTLLIPQLGSFAKAAPPTPSTDEAVYVNLDEYGSMTAMRIVKGVYLNGSTTISDYGDYSAVYNMTSDDKPKLREDGVDIDVTSTDGARFYYECIPNDPASLQMPWTFDVSYKLDGAPVKAEDLAGVSGLVEINIHAIPNPNASEYYRNNMTLMVGTGIDMSKTKSLEAPGAQIQSMGSYKFAVFLALPGEEDTYTIRIGSDKFETMGVYMMMAPATLSQLDDISDFRDVRDKLKDSHNDVYAGLSDLLDTMTGMHNGIQSMATGISGINDVRRQLIASRGKIDPDLDATLSVLDTLAGDTDALIPELTAMQSNMNALHTNTTDMLTTMTGMREDMESYHTVLKNMRNNLSNIKDFLDEMDDKTGANWLYLSDIKTALKNVRTDSEDLQEKLKDLRKEMNHLDGVGDTLTSMMQEIAANLKNNYLVSTDQEGNVTGINSETKKQLEALQTISENLPSIKNILETLNENGRDSVESTEYMLKSINQLLSASESIVGELEDINDIIEEYKGTAQDAATIAQKATELADTTLNRTDDLLAQIEPLQKTLDQANANLNSMVPKITQVTTSLTNTMRTSNTLFTDVRNTLRSLRDQSDSSMQQSLDGLIDVMQRAADSDSTNKSLQKATDTIHNTISDEIDDLEDDSNVLNMDNSLALQSFTSDKNPAPSSLQFIVRTDDISVDDMAETQAEVASQDDGGVWQRIVKIFKKIAEAITSALSS